MRSGAGNLLPGIAVANASSLPLLAVTSNNQHFVSYPSSGMFAEMDDEALLRPVTKWNSAIHDGRRIPELVHTALREAQTGRRGAGHLDLPQNVVRGRFSTMSASWRCHRSGLGRPKGRLPDPKTQAAAALLRGAQRPLIIAGGGLVPSGASARFRALAERLQAAADGDTDGTRRRRVERSAFVGTASMTSGPAFIQACREADVVLAVGCRFSPWL